MNSAVKYSYKLRPCFGSKELLLELDGKDSVDALQQDIFKILQEAGFTLNSVGDLWVNDELMFEYTSEKGMITITRDIWGLFFIVGNDNQSDILKIEHLLSKNTVFEKLVVDFSDYG